MPKVEMKQYWNHVNEVNLNTLTQGYQTIGPAISQGVAASARIGNIVHASALHIKGALNNNSGAESFVRFVVCGYDASIGDPTLLLFRNAGAGTIASVASVNGLDAMYYPLNKVDLHIYNDRVFKLAGSATGNAGANARMFSKFIKFGGRKIEWKHTATTPDWQYSVIWIASDANDDTSTGTNVELSYLERLYYKDA